MSVTKLFKQICEKYFFQNHLILKNLLNVNFKEIDTPLLDCFNSNDLDIFIKIPSSNKNDFVDFSFSNLIKSFNKKDQVDIKRIDSLTQSKSTWNYSFNNMYLFGKNVYIDRDDKWSFQECIEHILRKDSILNLSYYAWNQKYIWHNSDGSHHFAAASFIATNEKKEYKFDCNITVYEIDSDILKNLVDSFDMFVIHEDCIEKLNDCFNKSLLIYKIPQTLNTIILFEKNKKFDEYIKILQKFNQEHVLNLNAYLEERLKKQNHFIHSK